MSITSRLVSQLAKLVFPVIAHLAADADRSGGARRDRTDDLMLAKHALYQLSYGPLIRAAQESVSYMVDHR